MIFSDLIQDLEPVRSWPPTFQQTDAEVIGFDHINRSPTLRAFLPGSDLLCKELYILRVENLRRAGRVRKNSKCWQCRQPRLIHTYQSTLNLTLSCYVNYVVLSDHCHHCVITSASNCAVGWNSYLYSYAEWHNFSICGHTKRCPVEHPLSGK
jgi:hypothetical protein